MNNYVLITPARNEEKFIRKTIESVISQTILPLKWVIVSDGSTDKTDEIVESFANKYDFIQFLKTKNRPDRNFSSKAAAFNLGYEQLNNIQYDFIGNLDADITFENNYYELILKKFELNEKLGIAGGVRIDLIDEEFVIIKSSRHSVAGAFQLFRKECFDSIGGYLPLEYGGIDAVAETTARMQGWEVFSFPEFIIQHHRMTGSSSEDVLRHKFRIGIKYYMIGYHPLFPILRFGSLIFRKPYVIGSLISISGFFWATIRRYERPVTTEFVKYLKSEQKGRFRSWLSGNRDIAFRK
ncbi:MAG: glycosyltransferase family 2 protein [Ignavibacteria bacterium]|nr:glycosyltransferase family 2 protein [Ignavibacteria bacterium]